MPRVPHPRFVGATTMGPRGDAIAQLDWSVGQVLATLDRLRLTRNTLVIFTSDNGPVIDDGYRDQAVEKLGDHKPAGPFRGGKYSTFEGGTRVPFVVRWPARVKPGVSDALVSQVDLLASFSALVGSTSARGDNTRATVDKQEGGPRDSENVLPALLGTSKTGRTRAGRAGGDAAGAQAGAWKYIPPSQGPRIQQNTNTETGNDPEPQLYDLAKDPGERTNLAAAHPEKVRELAALLEGIRRPPPQPSPAKRPNASARNIVLAIADDWSFPHAEHLRRSNGQHAELRSHRARGRAVHPCVRGVAVVHAVTRGAPDRPGGSPAGGRRQPARVSPEDLRGVSRSPGRGRLQRRLHRQGLGSRPVRGRRAHQEPRGPAVQELR